MDPVSFTVSCKFLEVICFFYSSLTLLKIKQLTKPFRMCIVSCFGLEWRCAIFLLLEILFRFSVRNFICLVVFRVYWCIWGKPAVDSNCWYSLLLPALPFLTVSFILPIIVQVNLCLWLISCDGISLF